MSRSKKKTPITGMTGDTSEKQFKREVNRKFRRQEKQRLLKDEEPPLKTRDISNIYSGPKDGKNYMSKNTPEQRYFTQEEWDEIRNKSMRK